MKVRDVMTREVFTAGPDTPVYRVARWMRDRNVSAVPVVDAKQRVIGLVTDLDLIVRNERLEPPAFFQLLDGRIPLESPAHYQKRLRHILGTRAGEVMTEDVATVGPEMEIEDLAALMVKSRVDPLPVVEDGRLVGIVSRHDIVRMMARDFDEHGEDEAPDRGA